MVQELQDRSRTFRGITRMIRSSSWTTFKGFYKVLRGFKKVNKDLFLGVFNVSIEPLRAP